LGHDHFVRRSEPVDTYTLCNGRGESVQTFDLAKAIGGFGVICQLSRGDLLEVLRQAAPDLPLQMGTAVTGIVDHGDEVEVLAGTTSLGRFDLVVGANGIHSYVRRHVAGEVEMKETGWSGWAWWASADAAPRGCHRILGRETLRGVYPLRDRIGVIAAGPTEEIGHAALGSVDIHLRARTIATR
jgi:2-polyprenyl-6-methoxyphenol hydroxylase-like FAD-dependent oxidoreductase